MQLEELSLDAPHIVEEKQVITLEDFLGKFLKPPDYETQALRINATSILKMLGIVTVGVSMTRRTAKWLRANGYTATHEGLIFKVAMAHPPIKQYFVV